MHLQIDIGFEQLVQLAKELPPQEWTKLKQAVDEQTPTEKAREDFRNLLLNGPTFSEEQLDVIEETRKEINKWRTV
jgi:hypothetical protein